MKYSVVSENEIGVLLKTNEYSKNCENICFVHQNSYEKLKDKKRYNLKIKPRYIYLHKRESNASIEEHASFLVDSLKKDNINKINLMAVSYGTLISALCTKSEIIDKVIVFQAPFWGTPLADISKWNEYNTVVKNYMNRWYKSSRYLEDLKYGLENKWDLVDVHKITFVYGYSIKVKGIVSLHNRRYFCPEIKRITNMENDAVVPFPSKDVIDSIGFKKVIYLNNLYHICTALNKYHIMLVNELNQY